MLISNCLLSPASKILTGSVLRITKSIKEQNGSYIIFVTIRSLYLN